MKKRAFNTRLYSMYLIALIPLILFGLYKNGFELYLKDYVGFIGMLKPLILVSMGVAGSLLGGLLREWKSIKNKDFKIFDKFKGNIVEIILLSAILPLKTSPIIVFVIAFIMSAFLNKININRVALMFIVLSIINMILGINTFDNAYEVNTALNYDGLDLFLGMGTGGLFSTNILLISIAMLFLCFNKLYKKEMSISSILTFVVLAILPYMIMGQYTKILPLIFSYNILFVFVFIEPNLYSSSYTIKAQILSGIIIGVLTYTLSFFIPYLSACVSVLLVSLIKNILDRIFVLK